MFNNQLKLIKCLLVTVLLLSVSVSMVLLNTGTVDLEQSQSNIIVEEQELTQEESGIQTEDITDEVTVKKIHPGDIFSMSSMEFDVPDMIYGDISIRSGSTNGEGKSSSGNTRATDAGDDPGTATQLVKGGNWINDSVESKESSTPGSYDLLEIDWFYINVQEKGNLETQYIEIEINNSAPPDPNNPRQLRAEIYDPISIILNQDQYPLSGPLSGKTISNTDGDLGTTLLDYERLDAWEEGTLDASPPISGIFLIRIFCISDNYKVHYNITSVKVTTIKPVTAPFDMNNYPGNGSAPLEQPEKPNGISSSVLQNKDHWDWYDLSGFIKYYGPAWENKITYEVDITAQNTGGGSGHTWTEVWVIYDSEINSNTAFLMGDIMDYGGSMTINVPSEPIKGTIDLMQGTHAYIGIRSYAIGIASNQMFLQDFDGGIDYDLFFSVKLQNDPPFLSYAKLEPAQDYYFEEDEITFKIRYIDHDNDPPTYVNVTVDGTNYEMSSSTMDYVNGVEFRLKMDCSDLDNINNYPHYFNFSTSDGLEYIDFSLSSPKNQFKVIENQTPIIFEAAPDEITFDEDDDIYIMQLSDIFKDVDPPDGLEYSIRVAGNNYGQKYESSRIEVFIYQQTKLKFQLVENQHGDDNIVVKAKETLTRSGDLYTFYKSFGMNIETGSVEDAPTLASISSIQAYQGEDIYFQISASDPDILTDSDELTFSSNRSDDLGVDDLEDFELIVDDTDTTKANISFVPGNEHVGTFTAKVTVTDKDNLEDSQDVEFEIININDPPVIKEITYGTIEKDIEPADTTVDLFATEDEWFNITITVEDIDILIGESNSISFKANNHSFTNPIEFNFAGGNDQTGQLSVLPLNSDVGLQDINISVHDGKGGSDYITLDIEVENVNDPPNTPVINVLEVNGLTASAGEREFSVEDLIEFEGICTDDDEKITLDDFNEKLTYKWFLKSDKIDKQLKDGASLAIIEIQFPTPFLPRDDTKIDSGNFTLRLEVSDLDGVKRSAEIYIMLEDDFDNDQIPDYWEVRYDLNPHDREDALMDSDNDKKSNIDEYLDNTDPRDPSSYSGGKGGASSSEDSSLTYIILAVVVVIIVLLLLFMFINKNRKKQSELDGEVENLAYPSEDDSDMGLGMVMPTAPGAGIPPQMPPGMPQMTPEMFQQFQIMQRQMQARPQGPGQAGPGTGMGPMPYQTQPPTQQQQTQQSTAISQAQTQGQQLGAGVDTTLTPKLPPAKNNEEGDGRHSPIDSVEDDPDMEALSIDEQMLDDSSEIELIPGSPDYLDSEQTGELGITEKDSEAPETDENGENAVKIENNRMTCPNCGIDVKSTWFLCPGCKSPLN